MNKDFNPNIFHPFYFARKSLYQSIKDLSSHVSGDVLDVGCGKKPYKHLFNFSKYIGMDVEQSGHLHDNEEIDVYYDGTIFPFPDQSFDTVITSQVFEHVFNPELFMSEISRVLKPGGKLLLTVPFVWDEHEQPYDYARYSSFALKHIMSNHNLEISQSIKTLPDIRVLVQLINGYVFKIMFKKRFSKIIAKLAFIAPFNLFGLFFYKILPKNSDLYLDNVVLAIKK